MNIERPSEFDFSFNSIELNDIKCGIAILNNVIYEMRKRDCDTLTNTDSCLEVTMESLETAHEILLNLLDCNQMY